MAVQQNKYLTFLLENESYGIPILRVREIIGMMPFTHVPRLPVYVKGVINLRGKIIPVLDLRLKFGLTEREYTDRTCIIVVETEGETGKRTNGLVVDNVSDVLDIGSESIEPPPSYGTNIDETFLTGMGKVKEKVIMLLDADKVLISNNVSKGDVVNEMVL